MSLDFSVVLPTYNRCTELELTLRNLEQQRYHSWELLVVDNGSTDGTLEMLGRDWRLPLVVLQESRQGAGAARNLGIRRARGEFCLFVDDDVLACPELLCEHREAHRGHLRRLVRGPVINFDRLPAPSRPGPLWKHFSMNYLCTSNASIRRSLLEQAGLFDETFDRWEDAELGVRLKRLGVRRHFVSQAWVLHYKPPLTPEQQLRLAARDGQSAAQLYLRYPSLPMRLRSGLHGVNFLRNRLLTAGPLTCVYRGWLEQPGTSKARWALGLLAEREYLEAGRRELRKGR